MGDQAWAQNAVIVRDDGFSVRWKPRCPYCGNVPTHLEMCGTAQKGVLGNQSVRCDECGKSFDVVISRG